MIRKVLGPPGTGKTRRLLNEVDGYLTCTKPCDGNYLTLMVLSEPE